MMNRDSLTRHFWKILGGSLLMAGSTIYASSFDAETVLRLGIQCDGYSLPYASVARLGDTLVVNQRIDGTDTINQVFGFVVDSLSVSLPVESCKSRVSYIVECKSRDVIPVTATSVNGAQQTKLLVYELVIMTTPASLDGLLSLWGGVTLPEGASGFHWSDYPVTNCH